MPLIKSAKKANRQNIKRKSRNDHFKALYREARVSFEKAIKKGDAESARSILLNQKSEDGKNAKSGLQSIIDKLVKKNIIHKNTGSRRKSKFAKMLKSLESNASK